MPLFKALLRLQVLVFCGLQIMPISAFLFTWPSSLCVCGFSKFPLYIRSLGQQDLGPTLIQYKLILNNYSCKDSISKKGGILRFCETLLHIRRHYLTQDSFPSAPYPKCISVPHAKCTYPLPTSPQILTYCNFNSKSKISSVLEVILLFS